MSLSPDELDALADAATPDDTDPSCVCTGGSGDAWHALVALAPSLARDLAALQRKIRDAAEGEEHLLSRCRSYDDIEGAAIHGHAAATLRALLAEYAEMKEKT